MHHSYEKAFFTLADAKPGDTVDYSAAHGGMPVWVGRVELIDPVQTNDPLVERFTVAQPRARQIEVEAALGRFGIDGIKYSHAWEYSNNDLNLNPRPLDFDPETYLAETTAFCGSSVSIFRKELFYASSGDGTPAKYLNTTPRMTTGSHAAPGGVSSAAGNPGIPGWNSRKYLVRLVMGAYVSNHTSKGVKFDVWETKNV